MRSTIRIALMALLAATALLDGSAGAQTAGEREEFTAVAIANDDLGSGAATIIIQINRWSTDKDRAQFLDTLRLQGQEAAYDTLHRARSVGTIRNPGELAYDLRFVEQTTGEDGGRQILIITDRPIGFLETWHHARSVDYPFFVIQMEIGRDGRGRGTMSDAAKISPLGRFVQIENFTTARIRLTQIQSRKR